MPPCSRVRPATSLLRCRLRLCACSVLRCAWLCSLQGKQNRGKYQVIALKSVSAPPPASEAALAATAAASASARLAKDESTGLLQTPWAGPQWAANKLGIRPKQSTPSLAEMKERGFPGLEDVDAEAPEAQAARALQFGDGEVEGEAEMADAEQDAAASSSSPQKKPVTSLSRRSMTPSRAASRAASRGPTRGSTPAASMPGSPRSTPAKGSLDAMSDMSGFMSTPSRTPKAGASWKSVGSASPAHALVTSGVLGKSKTLRKSWSDKQKKRESFLASREAQQRLAAADSEQRKELARRAAQKAALKRENESKNQIVQVITDTRKIKNMSKKQLRGIQKMDTGAFKSKAVSAQVLSRGRIPKGE